MNLISLLRIKGAYSSVIQLYLKKLKPQKIIIHQKDKIYNIVIMNVIEIVSKGSEQQLDYYMNVIK